MLLSKMAKFCTFDTVTIASSSCQKPSVLSTVQCGSVCPRRSFDDKDEAEAWLPLPGTAVGPLERRLECRSVRSRGMAHDAMWALVRVLRRRWQWCVVVVVAPQRSGCRRRSKMAKRPVERGGRWTKS